MGNWNYKFEIKYRLSLVTIAVVVSFLIHMPEIIDLLTNLENNDVFPQIKTIEVLNEIVFAFISILILFIINTITFKFNQTTVKIGWQKLVLSFLLCLFVSTVLGNSFYYLHITFDIPAVESSVHHYLHPIRDFIIATVVTFSCYFIYINRKQQKIVLENQELKLENILRQYESLKSQLNPHMLFNSLNTLRSLIRDEPKKAQDYTQELSNVLRYMLQDKSSQHTTLVEEIEFVKGYTFLLEMRYEDNLIFDFDIYKEYNKYLLPPMSLQVLVENAVKHNEISNRHPLKVIIKTTSESQLQVYNQINPKLTHTSGTGIGLDNLVKRYRLLFNKDISIESKESSFCVTIPLIKPDHYANSNN